MFDPLRAKARVLLYTGVAFLMGLGVASGLGWTGPTFAMPTVTTAPQVREEAVRPAMELSEAFANVAQAVTPAVVRIEVETTRRIPPTSMRIPEEFRRFFNIPDPDQPQRQPEVPSLGGGSGFLISEDGYILTNDHVVANADRITVYLQDRRYFTASLVGTDPTTDVAVIKIDQTGLPFLSLGTSATARVGEWVLAVGNPGFGAVGAGSGARGGTSLDYTVTAGIISAKGRPLQLIRSELEQNPQFGQSLSGFAIEDFIQTDAVINRGNSGGPMVNLRGQVIGINSAIVTPTGYYAGYGFAIPVDLASRVMEDLIEYGRVRRAWLGVSIEAIALEDQEAFRLPEVAGVLVQGVSPGAPAASAGIQRGDVIYSVDGTVVYQPSGLQNLIAQKRPGDQVTVRIYREGAPREIRVRLGEAPLAPQGERAPEPPSRTEEEKLGISIQELTPELAQSLGYSQAGGVVISSVTPLGPAARRQVERGTKLVEVNGREIRSTQDVAQALRGVSGGEVVSLLLEFPDGSTRIVNVRAR